MPMRKSRFTEEQITQALRQAVTGTPVTEVLPAGRWGANQTYYSLEEAGWRFTGFDG